MATAQKKRELPAHVQAAIAALPETGTVTVACKLPNGLILRLFDMRETDELILGGGVRTVNRAFLKDLEPVTLKGAAAPFGSPVLTIGGYALTYGVDAQFFAEWLRQNYDSDVVKNRLVFAHETRDRVEDVAREQAEILSGLQPLSQERDLRSPSKVKTADLEEAA